MLSSELISKCTIILELLSILFGKCVQLLLFSSLSGAEVSVAVIETALRVFVFHGRLCIHLQHKVSVLQLLLCIHSLSLHTPNKANIH